MSVRIIPARSGKGLEFDIRITWPEGGRDRERGRCSPTGKDAAKRWAEAKERAIFAMGREAYRAAKTASSSSAPCPVVVDSAPTLDTFWPRVLRDHYGANRKKASTVDGADLIYKKHLKPALGSKPLDQITTADVAALKGTLSDRKPKTVNNVLAVLSRALRCAKDWEIIHAVPCKFGLLKVQETERDWYEVHDYRRLVDGAKKCGTAEAVLVLLAGSAGLRRGEIIALKWSDLDLDRKQARIARAVWRKVEDSPKGGKGRPLPLTDELVAALKAHRHLGERVLLNEHGGHLSKKNVATMMARAQRRAGLEAHGRIHVLRHTFCSHLAIAGVPPKAIQELAGHADLKTTMRYMHLAPSNRSEAMAGLTRLYGADTEAGRQTAG